MLKTRLLIIAFVASVLSVLSIGAANADDYAPPPFTADAPNNVEPGAEFSVTFSSGGVNCAWTSTFNGQTGAPGAGTDYTVSFTAPTTDGTYTVSAICTWDPEVVNRGVLAPISSGNSVTPAIAKTSSLVAVPQRDAYSVQIVVGDPSGDGDDDNDGSGSGAGNDDSDASGILPNTGGESLAYLAVGGALVAAGAAVTVAARRRKTA